MYYYDLPMHLDEKYTAMKNVYKGNTGDKKDFHVYAIQQRTQDDALGVQLLRKN